MTSWLRYGLIFLLVWSNGLKAQYRVRIELSDIPAMPATESIFVAGSFNGWNPIDTAFRIAVSDTITYIDFPRPLQGSISFKFTRGSWGNVECNADGSDISDRSLNLVSDTVIRCQIAAWKDRFDAVPKRHTASAQVTVLPNLFADPWNRTLRIYLPTGYAHTKKKYPVLYMLDGQNLFDEYLAFKNEWGVDECLDSLASKMNQPCIVVGVDAGTDRIHEYNPFDHPEYGIGKGDAFFQFLLQQVKPYIDRHYRTWKEPEHTIIAGSSLGGLMAYYGILKHPDVFGGAGVFSPAFWIAPEPLKQLTDSLGRQVKGKIFFYIGEREGNDGMKYVKDLQRISDQLATVSPAVIYSIIDPAGQHTESVWRNWFPEFYRWIMGNGFSYQTGKFK